RGAERRIAACEICDQFATGAEAGVERAIALVARQRGVKAGADVGRPRQDKLPVRLYGQGISLGVGKALLAETEIGGHFGTGAEAGVERAIAVVAHQPEVVAP